MRTIILYGALAKQFGKYHSFAVKNCAEAIRALKANFKGFESYMANAHNDGVGFKVFVGGHSLGDVSEIHDPSGSRDIIRIVPVIVGSKSGWFRIIVGAALVAAAVVVSGATFGAAAPLATVLGSLGASMIIGGVAQLLTKPPNLGIASQDSSKQSYIFSGATNVSAQGAAVPVVYGEMLVGSVVVSAGIESNDI